MQGLTSAQGGIQVAGLVAITKEEDRIWCMILMGVRDNHTNLQETQRWRPGTSVASGSPRVQNLPSMAKKLPFFGQFGAQDVLCSLSKALCTQSMGSMTFVWAQNTTKSALKSTLFAYFFKFHPLVMCLTAMVSLGALLVINNDEGDCLQPIFTQSTPINALLTPPVCTAHVLG